MSRSRRSCSSCKSVLERGRSNDRSSPASARNTTPDALIGKTIIIVANLKPAKLMGIESQGMVLAAGDSEVRGLATILEEVDPGTKVK